MDQVVVHVRDPASMAGQVFGEDFSLADAGPLRAINGDGVKYTPEKLARIEVNRKADPCHVPAHKTPFQPDADIIKDLLLVVQHRATEGFIAQDVCIGVHEIGIRRQHEHAEIARRSGGGLAVVDAVQGTRVGSSRRKARDGIRAVVAFDVELDEHAGRLAGQGGGIGTARRVGHGETVPSPAPYRIPKLDQAHPIRIFGRDGDCHRIAGVGNNGLMPQIRIDRADVGDIGRIGSAGGSVGGRNRQLGRACQPVEIEAGVQEAFPGQPFGAERDFIGAAIHDAQAVGKGGFDLVAGVLRRAGSDEMQHEVARVPRLRLNPAVAVVAPKTPMGADAVGE